MKRWLVTALLVLVLAASAVAAVGLWAIPIAGFTLATLLGIRLSRRGGWAGLGILVGLPLLAFLTLLLLPAIQVTREIGCDVCANNLKQIAMALHVYENVNHSFPPAFVRGPDGKPWHSWRVLILPYLDAELQGV